MPKQSECRNSGCLLGGCNPSTDEVNNVEIILESLLGAGCGILAAYAWRRWV
jgi:hypothetical protein